MLSYRHAFHAGNHADVLKHSVLIALIRYMQQKEKPFAIIDTHAGAGFYALTGKEAQKTAEFQAGIAKLWAVRDLPPFLADYVDFIKGMNQEALRHYPGSPLIAAKLLRSQDALWAFERHPKDFRALDKLFADKSHATKKIRLSDQDGFAGLKAQLPPISRRALAVIDPSYEEKQDYERVIFALKDAQTRFATGTYMLWYPQLQTKGSVELPKRLKKIAKDWLHVALSVAAPKDDGLGMMGSGLFVINPPWTLHNTLANALPVMTQLLAEANNGRFLLEKSEEAAEEK